MATKKTQIVFGIILLVILFCAFVKSYADLESICKSKVWSYFMIESGDSVAGKCWKPGTHRCEPCIKAFFPE